VAAAALHSAEFDPLIAGRARILPLAHPPRPTRSSEEDLRALWKVHKVLRDLRAKGRRAISIIDTRCWNGDLLVRAARHARALGFVAIEARGFDASAGRVAAARAAARAWPDPGIGFVFEVRPRGGAFPIEDLEVDILIGSTGLDSADELVRLIDPRGAAIMRD
jgi:hypothetical protein